MQKIISEKIENITKNRDKIVFNDATIYLIDENDLKILLELKNRVEEQETNKKNPFNKYAKIINPTQKAVKYNFYIRKTPRIITDPQKVKKNLEKEFILFKNVLLKSIEESIVKNALLEKDAKKLRDEAYKRIEKEEKILQDIINNFGNYEVRISNYKNIRSYPAIHFTTEDGKHKVEHLSIRVPNFLYFQEAESKDKSNASIKEFIRKSNLLGNSIFYIKKK